MNVKDYILCFIKSLFQTLIVVILSLGILYIIRFNLNVANYISNITGIPSDMSISIMSAGFVNNIVILMLVIEIILFAYFFQRIMKTSFFKKASSFIVNL